MKQILTIFLFTGLIHLSFSQEIASTNSGANSNSNIIYSVGEVFVVPIDQDQSSSGGIGVVSRIEFTSLGIEDIQFLGDLKFYPNPTTHSIFLELESQEINEVFIYDLNGRMVVNKKIIDKQVSLQELQSGVYFVKTNQPNIRTFKIIKN